MTKKATDEADDTEEGVATMGETQGERSLGSASSGVPPEASATRPLSSVETGSAADASSRMGLTAQRRPQSIPEWQAMNPSMYHTAVAQHQMMGSTSLDLGASLSARGSMMSQNEPPGIGTGFVSQPLAGLDATATAGQAVMLPERGMAASGAGASAGSAFVRTSAAAPSSQSSSSDQQEALRDSLAAQHLQQPIDPRLLASIASAANPFLQPQPSLGAALPGAPSMDDYQAALLRAASSSLFRDLSQRDPNVAGACFGAGYPPNLLGLGAQNPSLGAAGLPMTVPGASQYASLRGGSDTQRPDISIPSHERGKRPMGTHPAMTGVTRGILEPFPERLHRLLSEVDAAGHSDVISFTEDGQAFKIHKPEEFFRKIVQVYFKQTRLSSFKRQLNLYGFELIDHGPSKGGYYHELFMRDEPELARQIRRVGNRYISRDKTKKKGRYSSSAPDFYSMPPIMSSEEAEKKLAANRASGEDAKMETDSTSSESSSEERSGRSRKKRKSDDDEPDAKTSASEPT